MASALMEAEDSSMISENTRTADLESQILNSQEIIAGLESQVLNSQEIILRLNRELDNASLRITTLENVCAENQNDLHEKRNRLKKFNDELDEKDETIERLNKELSEKNNLIYQFQQENEFGDISQIQFDRQLRELIFHDFDDENSLLNNSPQEIIYQYHNNERLKFYNLLQECLITEDISNLIDSDDILFQVLTRLNSLNRLKETLSRDSKELYHIRSLLHLTDHNNDEVINDLINKRQCIEYLRSKIDNNHDLNDFDLIKYVLHDYFNFQQQQIELKEYLKLNQNNHNDLNYSRIFIQRYNEAIHVRMFFIYIDLSFLFFI
jgi:chromosome segregation ATPase